MGGVRNREFRDGIPGRTDEYPNMGLYSRARGEELLNTPDFSWEESRILRGASGPCGHIETFIDGYNFRVLG
jgi:hypothetical protein